MLTILMGTIPLALLIGFFGRKRRMGFWGLTFGSILFTPLIGLLILLLTDDVKQAA